MHWRPRKADRQTHSIRCRPSTREADGARLARHAFNRRSRHVPHRPANRIFAGSFARLVAGTASATRRAEFQCFIPAAHRKTPAARKLSNGCKISRTGIIRAAPSRTGRKMKAHVWVMPKPTVLDPQGQTIQRALGSLGHSKVQGVRQGKFFVLELDGLSRAEAQSEVERIAKDVLTNTVIEEFRFEVLE